MELGLYFSFVIADSVSLYDFGNDQSNWSTGANRVTIKYSDFTTVIWKMDNDQYSRFIVDGYSPNDEAVASMAGIVKASGMFDDLNWYRAFDAGELQKIYEFASDKMNEYVSAKAFTENL